MEFYKLFMITEHAYKLTNFHNSMIMDIHGTSDDSWRDLWNDSYENFQLNYGIP